MDYGKQQHPAPLLDKAKKAFETAVKRVLEIWGVQPSLADDVSRELQAESDAILLAMQVMRERIDVLLDPERRTIVDSKGVRIKIGSNVSYSTPSYQWNKTKPIGPANLPKPTGPMVCAFGKVIEICDDDNGHPVLLLEAGKDLCLMLPFQVTVGPPCENGK